MRQQKGDHGKAWGYFFLLMFLVVGLTLIPLFVGLPKGVSTIQSKFASDVPSFAADLKGGELVVTELVQPYVVKENEMVSIKIEKKKPLLVKDVFGMFKGKFNRPTQEIKDEMRLGWLSKSDREREEEWKRKQKI